MDHPRRELNISQSHGTFMVLLDLFADDLGQEGNKNETHS